MWVKWIIFYINVQYCLWLDGEVWNYYVLVVKDLSATVGILLKHKFTTTTKLLYYGTEENINLLVFCTLDPDCTPCSTANDSIHDKNTENIYSTYIVQKWKPPNHQISFLTPPLLLQKRGCTAIRDIESCIEKRMMYLTCKNE